VASGTRRGIGRGLSAILPEVANDEQRDVVAP